MKDLAAVVPLLLLAGIVALILAPMLRRRVAWKRPVRAPRPKKSTLLHVSRDQMDEDLKDLIKRS